MAFPVSSVIDNFNRNDNSPPSASWTNLALGLSIISNVVGGTAAGTNIGYWSADQFGPDMEAYVTVSTVPQNGRLTYVYARMTDVGAASVMDAYAAKLTKTPGNDLMQLVYTTNGSENVLGADFSQEIANGQSFGIEVVGSVLTLYVNTGAGWTSLGSRGDTNLTGAGHAGLGLQTTVGRVDDFGAGTISSGGGGGELRTPTRPVIFSMNHFRGGTVL